jgi:predicted dehydrogenase
VIGAGALGFHHVRLLRDLSGARLVGFHDIRPERADQVSRELDVKSYDDVASLVEACDALTVVVPTPSHYEVARIALERGRHLLIEKPLTATLDEADELLAIAERTGALVQTGHVERFNRAIRGALAYVDRPRFIESDRLAPFSPRGADVAVVLDLMIHDIDLILTLVGEPVEQVQAVGVPILTSFADIANARLVFSSGAVANITASRVSRERMRKLRIFQPSGYISLDLASGDGEFYRLRNELDFGELARAPLALEAFVERIAISAPEGEPLRLEFESFLAAVQGRGAVTVSGRAGRDALAVALRIQAEIERTLVAASRAGGSGA